MNGINRDRLSELRRAAKGIEADMAKVEDRYYDFASAAEKAGRKTMCYAMSLYDDNYYPSQLLSLGGENVLIFVRDGEHKGEMVEGKGTSYYGAGRPYIQVEGGPGDPNAIVPLGYADSVFVEQPANYKESGFVKNISTDPSTSADDTEFWHERIRDDAATNSYNDSDWEKGIPDGVKRLNGERVLATVRDDDTRTTLSVKGDAAYVPDTECLTVKVNDKLSCNVKVRDIEFLDVEENFRDPLLWRPLKNHYIGIPASTYNARIERLPENFRTDFEKTLQEDAKLMYLYFGGDRNDGTSSRNLPEMVALTAGHGYDADACFEVAKTSGWYEGPVYDEKLKTMIVDAVNLPKKSKTASKKQDVQER